MILKKGKQRGERHAICRITTNKTISYYYPVANRPGYLTRLQVPSSNHPTFNTDMLRRSTFSLWRCTLSFKLLVATAYVQVLLHGTDKYQVHCTGGYFPILSYTTRHAFRNTSVSLPVCTTLSNFPEVSTNVTVEHEGCNTIQVSNRYARV